MLEAMDGTETSYLSSRMAWLRVLESNLWQEKNMGPEKFNLQKACQFRFGHSLSVIDLKTLALKLETNLEILHSKGLQGHHFLLIQCWGIFAQVVKTCSK